MPVLAVFLIVGTHVTAFSMILGYLPDSTFLRSYPVMGHTMEEMCPQTKERSL